MTEQEKHALIECAKYSAELAKVSHQKSIDEHNAAFRWLLASLFALNGGAIVAIINSSNAPKSLVHWPASLFFAGILAAFWMAIMAQNSDRRMIAAMAMWGAYWTEVSVTCEINPDRESEISRLVALGERFGRRGRQSGIISMALFGMGCILVWWHLSP